jgi:hypothetical protein
MTSQGSLYGQFQKALKRRNVLQATTLARELGSLSLAPALALTILYAYEDPARYDRAAARWLGRYAIETGATLNAVNLAGAALAALPAEEALAALYTIADGIPNGRSTLALVAA